MKKYLTILACFFLVCSFFSCKEEEDFYNIPRFQESVFNEKANVINATSAEIRMYNATLIDTTQNGYVRSYNYYLRYSLSPDMANPSGEFSLSSRSKKLPGMYGSYHVYYFDLKNLTPNTTYYYKVYVKGCGDSEFGSSVKSFTTSSTLRISKVTYTDWDGEVKEVDESMSPLGLSVVDTDGRSTRNLMVTYQNGEWRVPDEILGKDIKECGIYTPYKKESDYMNEDALGWLRLCTYKNGKNSVDDVLTGYAYLKDDKSVSLRLSHALARVRFHFTIAEDCNEENLKVQSFIIDQEASSKIIPSIFFYSLYGKITSVGEFMDIDSGESFVMTKKSQSDVTILSGETCSSGTVQAKIQLSNGSTYSVPITLKADSWKSGNTYDYNIVYSRTGLTLSDVTVNEWNKNEGGDINIYE